MNESEQDKKAVEAVKKVLNKSDEQKEKEFRAYLKKTKGKSQMTREHWYKFNYNQEPPRLGIKKTKLSRQSQEELKSLDAETYKDVMKSMGK
jgi:hypothetical protein